MQLYSLLLTVGLALSAPWWLLRMATTRRYREGLGERLGLVPQRLRSFVASSTGTSTGTAVAPGRLVWVHAVSVGEVLAAGRLVGELETALAARFGVAHTVVLSTTTRAGQQLARQRFGAERVFYMPLDFAFALRPYLRLLRPRALVLMESELWPRLLHECWRSATPVAVANARVSDRSFARALRLRWLWARVVGGVTLWLAQSEEDARRLRQMGAHNARVRALGNLKYDTRAPGSGPLVDAVRHVAAGRRVLVAGSTVGPVAGGRQGEESILLRAWEPTLRGLGVLLVIAPRHPERFDEVCALAARFHTVRASTLLAETAAKTDVGTAAKTAVAKDASPVEIVVLDTIGQLASLYQLADVAFVGGSLVPRGGHNPLEPAQFAVPVVVGASYENFRAIIGAMQAGDGIAIVPSATRQTEESDTHVTLEKVLIDLFANPEAATALGRRGQAVFERQQGTTARTTAALVAMVAAGYGASTPGSSPAGVP